MAVLRRTGIVFAEVLLAVGCVYACRYHIFVYIHILHESPHGTIEKGRGQDDQERIVGAHVQST